MDLVPGLSVKAIAMNCQEPCYNVEKNCDICRPTWVYGYYWKRGGAHYVITESQRFCRIYEETLCRYIGREDANKHPIYSNDKIQPLMVGAGVVILVGEPRLVVYDEFNENIDTPTFLIEVDIPTDEGGKQLLNGVSYQYEEIIGNIFDNYENVPRLNH